MSWLTRIMGVDRMVENKLNSMLNKEFYSTSSPESRAIEYQAWASANAEKLRQFYMGKRTFLSRRLFWEVAPKSNIPQLHYPASEAVMNHMQALLFSGDVDIFADTKNEKRNIELNERLKFLMGEKGVNINELFQKASNFETYSGTIAIKFIIDKDVKENSPILEVYPRERFELKHKHKIVQAIIFKDPYRKGKKEYMLHSIYGKGYIEYELLDDKGDPVPLSTIPELADLEPRYFNESIIMACWKKNKAINKEFSDDVYGGSDFEGVLDLFQSQDEQFSNLMAYTRALQPRETIDERLLPVSQDGSHTIVPTGLDNVIVTRSVDEAVGQYNRDAPELKTEYHWQSLWNTNKAIYYFLGLSYTTFGLAEVGANASGAALVQREKSTVIIRDSKIKLWIPFIQDLLKLLLIYEDLLNSNSNIITNLYDDVEIQVEFPEYNGQTFAELVEELAKAKVSGLIDTETAVERLYNKDYTIEQRKVMTRNIKIENAEPMLDSQLVNDEGVKE